MLLKVVQYTSQERPGRIVSSSCPGGVFLEGIASKPGVVVVLSPWKEICVPGPCHRSGGKGPAKLFPPHRQTAETKPSQGGIVLLPPSPTDGRHRHPLAPFNRRRLPDRKARVPHWNSLGDT